MCSLYQHGFVQTILSGSSVFYPPDIRLLYQCSHNLKCGYVRIR